MTVKTNTLPAAKNFVGNLMRSPLGRKIKERNALPMVDTVPELASKSQIMIPRDIIGKGQDEEGAQTARASNKDQKSLI